MLGLNSGLLGSRRVPTTSSASGLWVPNEQSLAKRAGIWPTGGDPYFANVSLLLHMDGSNGSTTFTDSSPAPSTISAYGNAAISTAQKQFGTGSLALDGGSANYLTAPANTKLDMGAGDFTIECWVRLNSMPTGESYPNAKYIFGTGPANSGNGSQLYIGSTNLKFDLTSDGSGEVVGGHGMTTNTWYHVAVTRFSHSFRGFVNGTQVGSTVTRSSASSWQGGYNWGIGAAEPGTSLAANFNGYIDELRITKGVARYTANFTPPTAAFPDA